MNWSRGLFRAWLLLSALWLIASGLALIDGWPEPRDAEAVEMLKEADCEIHRQIRILREVIKGNVANQSEHTSEEVACLMAADKQAREYVRWHLIEVALGATVPPMALFILGWAGLWVARGFVRHRRE